MGWIDVFKDSIVAIDTAPVIYFIERHPRYVDTVREFFQAIDRGDLRACRRC
jgi:hypothetical protein